MQSETVGQLRELAAGDSRAAFKSAAMACGLSESEAELVWRHDGQPGEVVADVRDAGMEIRSEDGWLTSSVSVEVER
ncbi:hypothetical protein [Halorussus marinus]|uniref:hypothetical protein n=1 Tax=Halorussus marinus TaxID=2505976 RepID=UPI001091D5F2|nr:hypothetical protein [Halorussus marinus]